MKMAKQIIITDVFHYNENNSNYLTVNDRKSTLQVMKANILK